MNKQDFQSEEWFRSAQELRVVSWGPDNSGAFVLSLLAGVLTWILVTAMSGSGFAGLFIGFFVGWCTYAGISE